MELIETLGRAVFSAVAFAAMVAVFNTCIVVQKYLKRRESREAADFMKRHAGEIIRG